MHCPTCGHSNLDGARFCSDCGARLQRVCPGCGALPVPGARFCSDCGAALVAPSTPAQASVPSLPASFAGGRYAVKRFLGEGGKKQVYLAYDTLLDRDIAFSLIKTAGLDESGIERIRREARLMGRLGGHPHIVSIYDMGDEDGRPFLVSELMAGGDVDGLIENAPEHRPPLTDTLRLGDQICQALEYAHSHGIIHRDLKPGNVWLTRDGVAKLGDFGLAVAIDTTRLSIAGMIVGTVGYMPPEQAMGKTPDARSDLYSLGAMLYEMVAGRPPFLGDDPVAIISQHVNTPPVAPSWHNPAVPRPLEALILRLLAKDPAERQASAELVRQEVAVIAMNAASIPTTSEQLAAAELANPLDRLAGGVFVGRERELDTLRLAFDASLSGRAGTVLLAGEPGIGKTRLAEELGTYATLRGAQVLWGRSYEWEGAPAYWPWVQMLRDYVHERDPQALRSEMGSGAGEIGRIVSEVRERLPGLPEPPPAEGEAARFRLFEAIAGFLRNASTHQPLVLVFDDLHWADKPTLLLLQFVVRELRASRLLVLGTYRDSEVGRQHPLGQAMAELVREPRTQRLSLRGLEQDDIGRYVALTTGKTAPERMVDAVYGETEGNAFFVTEVVRLLASEGRLSDPVGARASSGWSDVLPQGVRDVVGRRLDRLSVECNELLTIASVIGREFSLALLERVSERPADEVLDLLEEAVQARVVRDEGTGRYRFSQELIQETLTQELSAGRRMRLHARIGDAIEQVHAHDLPSQYADLAFHFGEAVAIGRGAAAIDYAIKAGERAVAQLAWETAVIQYERALGILDTVQPRDERRRCVVSLALGKALWDAGQVERGRAAYLRAAEIGRSQHLPEQLARAALGFSGADFPATAFLTDDQIPLLEEASVVLPAGDSVLRASVLAKLGSSLWLDGADQERAAALGSEAVSMSRRLNEPEALMLALVQRQWQLTGPESITELRETSEELRLVASASPDPLRRSLGSFVRFVTEFELGDVSAGARLRDEVYRQDPRFNEPSWQVPIQSGRLAQAAASGRFMEAEQLYASIQSIADAYFASEETLLGASLPMRREQGRLLELDDVLNHVLETTGGYAGDATLQYWRATRALADWELGRVDQSREAFNAIAAGDFARIRRGEGWFVTVATLSELAAYLGDAERASILYQRLEPFTDRTVHYFYGSMWLGACSRFLGLLATVLERFDDAERHFADAIAMNERMGARTFTARTHYDFANLLVKRNAPGDRTRALEQIDQALAVANEIGMSRLAEQALDLKVRFQGILKA